MKRTLLLLMLFPALATASNAQVNPMPEPRQLAEQLMRYVATDDIGGLFRHMRGMTQMDKAQLDDSRDNIIKQRKPLIPTLGPTIGASFVSECRRGDFLTRVIFAEKRAKTVMRWQFVFYRARDKWEVIYFYWDDKIPDLFAPCT